MKQPTIVTALSAASLLQSVLGQQPAIVRAGVESVCVDQNGVIIYEQPAYYSTIFNTAGTIFNFLGGTNSLVIENPPQTIITSTILTTTIKTTATTTATVTTGTGNSNTGSSATIGQGIPAGTITAIPSTLPFALAYVVDAELGRRPSGFAGDNGTSSDPADADSYYLQDGELRTTDGRVVGRNESDAWALISATLYENEFTTTFYLVDGFLVWDSPDRGEATFYQCGNNLFAGFNSPPPYNNCTEATIGAISKSALAEEPSISSTTSQRSSTAADAGNGSRSSTTASRSSDRPDSGTLSTTSRPAGGSTTSGSTVNEGSMTTASSSSDDVVTLPSTSSTTSVTMTSSAGGSSPTPGGDSVDGGCPGSPYGSLYFGYDIYCGYVVDPVDPSQDLGYPDGTPAESFDECTVICDTTDGCTGLSYIEASGTCYVHGGENIDPVARAGWDGATKSDGSNGGNGSESSSTTTGTTMTTTQADGPASSTAMTTASSPGAPDAESSSTTSSSMIGTTSEIGGAATTSGTTNSMTGTTSTMTGIASTFSTSNSGIVSTTEGAATTSGTTSADTGGASTTTTATTTTTTTAAASLCPATPSGASAQGFEIYCGYSVDPANDLDNIGTVGGNKDVASFEDCLALCTNTPGCTGLTYFEPADTCYMHTGDHKAPVANEDYNGAILIVEVSTTTTATSVAEITTTTTGDNIPTTTTTTGIEDVTTTTTPTLTITTTTTAPEYAPTTTATTTAAVEDATTTTTTATAQDATTTTTTTPLITTTSTTMETTTTTSAVTTTISAAGGGGGNNPPAQDAFLTGNGCTANTCRSDNDGSINTDTYSTFEYFFFDHGLSGINVDSVAGVENFGACIDLCTDYVDTGSGPCTGVSYDLDGADHTCYLHNDCNGLATSNTFYSAQKIPSGCTAPAAAQPRSAILAANVYPGPYAP